MDAAPIVKSNSLGDLPKIEEHNVLSILSEDEAKDVDVEEPSSSGQNLDESNLSAAQIAFLASTFAATFVPPKAHIMTKIISAYRNVLSFSPLLFHKPSLQAGFSIAMMVPPLCIIFLFLIHKIGLLSDGQVKKPGRFFKKVLKFISIPVFLHTGESIGYFLGTNNAARYILILIDIIGYMLYWIGNALLYTLGINTSNDNGILRFVVKHFPFVNTIIFSICNNKMPHPVGVITYLSFFTTFFILSTYLVIKKKPFADSKWNKRATSTLLAGFEIVVSNTLCYFFKKILVWILGVRYFAVIFTIISEYGTLPLKDIRKSLKRQKKRAAYSEGLEDQNNRMQRPLIYIEKQDIFNVVFFLVSVLSGTYANAHAAQRMPIGKALPDLVHDFFKCGEEIRGAEEFLKMQYSNLMCVLLIVGMFVLVILAPDRTNVKKIFFLYGFMMILRLVAFLITSMPAPCSGLPNCPCADKNEIENLKKYSAFRVAVTWTTGMGMFAKLPQCGDLIISGHTMFLWLSFKWIMEAAGRMVRKTTAHTIDIISVVEFIIIASYITLSRNHYTIDVWLGFLLAEATFDLYVFLEQKAQTSSNNLVVRFVRWFETRTYPITKEDYGEAETTSGFDA